jgi:hypothetical protein
MYSTDKAIGGNYEAIAGAWVKARYTFSGDALITLCNETLLSDIQSIFGYFLLVWLLGSPVFYVVTA